MKSAPKKVLDRFRNKLKKYKPILESAKSRDVNESDTSLIVAGILTEMLGYDRFVDVTTEYSIRSTYCDLAVKVGTKLVFLIEVKAIGVELKENHLKQAVDYAANEGTDWVILTNGEIWQLHRVRFGKPINNELVVSLNFLELDLKDENCKQALFAISKEGVKSSALPDYYEHRKATSRYVVAATLLTEPVCAAIKRTLKKVSSKSRISDEEVLRLLTTEIIKRDCLDGEEAAEAAGIVRKASGKRPRKTVSRPEVSSTPTPPSKDAHQAAVSEATAVTSAPAPTVDSAAEQPPQVGG